MSISRELEALKSVEGLCCKIGTAGRPVLNRGLVVLDEHMRNVYGYSKSSLTFCILRRLSTCIAEDFKERSILTFECFIMIKTLE